MAKYGNILTVFQCDESNLQRIRELLDKPGFDFLEKEQTFFISCDSKEKIGKLVEALELLGVSFIFFHNNICTGSVVRSHGIDDDFVNGIKKVLL
jgi:hypothetical protein